MSKDWIFSLFACGFGLLLAIRCPRAAWREFTAGIAKGQLGDYERAEQPGPFWAVIIGTMLAGVMGVFFVIFGIAVLVWGM